ncbi:MAG: BREX-6 system adenine-specific DNA-methyltransferase PglX [Myxococcaceae bacterium]
MSTALTRNRLTPESKALLRKTVRGLRESLLRQMKESAEQRFLLLVPAAKAASTLDAATLERRRRLEEALDHAAAEDGGGKDARTRAFDAAAKEAGATLLNRLVLLRHLEALEASRPRSPGEPPMPAVVTGGWMSKGYQEFQRVAPALCEDETQGMAPLLSLLFAELAVALPGLFGDVGLTGLFDVPPATLREVIEALDAVPAEAWRDDLTLGWVYQYWNDPDREALDAKIAASGKIEPHEIASKTQMFTERYMVEWLLQNSLGPTWLAICKKHGWTPEVESSGVLAQLDARRAAWRKRREAGEVAADTLMPIEGPLEEAWKYYVPQPLPAAVVEAAPDSLRELKLLDPACGSGHFLVVAFDLLVELYREEARHRGETWGDRQIAEWILENNLHGIDIDPRAVQIAAAAVYLKARALAKDAAPHQVNLVAPSLKLSALPKDDPGLVRLEADLQAETGIPPDLTGQLIETLEGVDHLGSLLKVGDAIDSVLSAHEGIFAATGRQRELFGAAVHNMPLDRAVARQRVEVLLSTFLASHAKADDLGIRLRGQQLSAGLRFASIAKEGSYHLVVGNPPYQGTSKMKSAGYVAKHYPMGKSDLYAAFLERGLQLCRPGGASAMVTMRAWLFLTGLQELRQHLLKTFDLRSLGDVDRGAFEEIPDEVVATVMSVFRRTAPASEPSIAMQPTPLSDKARDSARTGRKRAAILAQVGRFEFAPRKFPIVETAPVLYWWSGRRFDEYQSRQKIGQLAQVRFGANTGDNARFSRKWWEVDAGSIWLARLDSPNPTPADRTTRRWVPYVMGSKGREWFEELSNVLKFGLNGLELKTSIEHNYGPSGLRWKLGNEDNYFRHGISFPKIGQTFSARAHIYASVFGDAAPTILPKADQLAEMTLLLNSSRARTTLSDLNPTVNFGVGDVLRLDVAPLDCTRVFPELRAAFLEREQGRESSVEFLKPRPNSWLEAQSWAQRCVDSNVIHEAKHRPAAVDVDPMRERSFQIGIGLGRFPRSREQLAADSVLPHGILFVSARATGDSLETRYLQELRDGLAMQAVEAREWLINEFWAFHRSEYENRPTYYPLSSSKRSFVAYVSIHRWTADTLAKLLADYLIPERKTLEGSLADLRSARADAEKKSRSENDRLFAQQSKWLEELEDFIAKVTQCAEKGPLQPDANTPAREADAPFVMDLDDGVMVNAASLWPLLDPMWKDPKKWWKELATAKGRKDYDWSHVAARYFPTRVDEKCRKDPSLAVAHGCFWKYHPEKAYEWELRLQDEIGPDFRITEKDSDSVRRAFLKKEPRRAAELESTEKARRERKSAKQDQNDLDLEAGDADSTDDEDAA